jgi:2-aminobenzoylacetyl-CoA thioesterase
LVKDFINKDDNPMIKEKYKPITITPHLFQLGTHDFPVYLSLGNDGMLIEGGTGAFFTLIVNQIKELGIAPERIKYVALTHTHHDHIGALPHLKKLWPHLQVIGSAGAAKALAKLTEKEKALEEFLITDNNIARIQFSKGAIKENPPELDKYVFKVDRVLKEGDVIDLGSDVRWKIYSTPGHSPCHISFYNEKDGSLVIGDMTGFYVPEQDVFWPNYTQSLETYCLSIKRLSALPARRLLLSHHGVIEGKARHYFQNALRATEQYHSEMIQRLGRGEDPEKIALEKAKWVNSLTDIQTFDVMLHIAKILIEHSRAVSNIDNLFTLP